MVPFSEQQKTLSYVVSLTKKDPFIFRDRTAYVNIITLYLLLATGGHHPSRMTACVTNVI